MLSRLQAKIVMNDVAVDFSKLLGMVRDRDGAVTERLPGRGVTAVVCGLCGLSSLMKSSRRGQHTHSKIHISCFTHL